MDRNLIDFNHVRAALALDQIDGLDAQMRMAPNGRREMRPSPLDPPRQSAVLVLIYPKAGAGLHLILTKRTDSLRGHSGQVSFPGGSVDPEDGSLEATALRETCEELGICETSRIRIIGRLTKMWIPPSNFDVYPVVATTPYEPDIYPNSHEVAAVVPLALADLLDDRIKRRTPMTLRGMTFDVPYYDVAGHIVWGATAGMLSELEWRLRTVLDFGRRQ